MNMRKWCVVLAAFSVACAVPTEPPPKEGFVDVIGGRIWYQTMGSGHETPLVVIHGGPGARSCGYLASLAQLAESRPVIVYDQLGSGRSDRPSDTTLWSVPRFVDELSRLREALDLEELHIMGHSWGGSVAVEYMLTKAPAGVRSLILAGPVIDTEQWIEDTNELRTRLPEDVQAVLTAGEESKDFDSPEYLAATDAFYARFLYRSGWPREDIPQCDGVGEFNMEVYEYMWGPEEFVATGTLREFDLTDRLHELHLPVMFIVGRYDEARPETMFEFQRLIPGSVVEVIEDAAHMNMFDQPERFNTVVGEFIAAVEAR
jgi:proline iminopeptidase